VAIYLAWYMPDSVKGIILLSSPNPYEGWIPNVFKDCQTKEELIKHEKFKAF